MPTAMPHVRLFTRNPNAPAVKREREAQRPVTMVSRRPDKWIGTPERLLTELSAFRIRHGPQLLSNPFVVATTAIAQSKEVRRTLASSSSELMADVSARAQS